MRFSNGATREVRPDLTSFGQVYEGADPDIFYVSGTNGRGEQGLWRVDLRSGATTLVLEGATAPISADGKRAYFFQRGDGRHRFIERDLASGKEREMLSYEAGTIPLVAYPSPDGTKVYYRLPRPGAVAPHPESVLMGRDVASGAERPLLEGRLGGGRLSPDGRYIAVARSIGADESSSVITLVRTSGDPAPRDLPGSAGLAFSAWAPDSRSLLLMKPRMREKPAETWWVPLDGTPRRLSHHLGALAVHPDGKTLAFARAAEQPRRFEIMALENFLPAGGGKKGAPRP